MIITDTGKICDGFYGTGSAATPVYLLDGPLPVLFDGGFTAFASHYENDINTILNGRRPAWLFLTHSHFDHVGAVSRFKQLWPELKIFGSRRCKEILSNEKAVALIRELNREGAENFKNIGTPDLWDAPFETFDIDQVIEPGDTFRLCDDLSVCAIHTPGHTWDFFSYWIPEKKILVASEAVACYEHNGYIQTEFLVDFDTYLDSLTKLERLGATTIGAGHHASFTGRHAAQHIQDSVRAANDFADMAQRFLKENHDIDRAVLKIKAKEWDPRPWPKQPEPAYLLNIRQRVKTILSRMKKNKTCSNRARRSDK